MTEALWLADFVTRFELSSDIKKHILKRIKSLGDQVQPTVMRKSAVMANLPPHIANQSPSTIANFLKEGVVTQPETLVPPAAAAVTPQAAAAINERNTAIQRAASAGIFSGKPEPGRTSPRKF